MGGGNRPHLPSPCPFCPQGTRATPLWACLCPETGQAHRRAGGGSSIFPRGPRCWRRAAGGSFPAKLGCAGASGGPALSLPVWVPQLQVRPCLHPTPIPFPSHPLAVSLGTQRRALAMFLWRWPLPRFLLLGRGSPWRPAPEGETYRKPSLSLAPTADWGGGGQAMASPLERWLLLIGLVERRGSLPCESECAR